MRCPTCSYLNKGKGKCQVCDFQMTAEVIKKPYRIPKKSEKQVDVKKKDIAYYKQCFQYSNRRCEECNLYLGDEWKPEFVSHIIAKNVIPDLRYDERNHTILCFDHHFQFDFGDKTKMKIYKATELIRQELTLEHYGKDKFED